MAMIPEGWEISILSEISEITSSKRIMKSEYVNDGIPFYRSKEIILKSKDVKLDKVFYIKESRFKDLKEKYGSPQKGDLLITAVGTIGITYLVKNEEFYFKDGNLLWIRRIHRNVNPNYLIHFFKTKLFKEQINFASGGSSQKALTIVKLDKLKVMLPPLSEQKKIAFILSSVDGAMQATQKVIDQTELVKKGLLQELLTKGIGHTEFKMTEIGEIPVDWEVGRVSDIIDEMKSGLSRRIVSQDIGIPVMISGNIQEGKLNIEKIKYWYRVDPQGADTDKYFLNDGDILLCFINSISQIGKLCIYQDIGREAIYTTNLFRIIPKKDYSSEFLYFLFYTPYFQDEIQLITKPAVNQASFTKEDFLKIKIPILTSTEQKQIASILSSVDDSIQKAKAKKEQLVIVKKGLMQDLLTGKVRVKV